MDDEEDLALILRCNLESVGFRVLTATSAETGLELFRKSEPHMVVLDVTLPAMDGFEMLRLLRLESGVPVVLLSGRSGGGEDQRARALGADDYVVKPFEVGALLARLTALLRRPG